MQEELGSRKSLSPWGITQHGIQKTLVPEKQKEKYIVRDEEKEKSIEDYVDRETAVARQWVEDAETAIKKKLQEMRNAENSGLKTREPEWPFEDMIIAIGDILTDLASCNDEKYGEDEDDEDRELGKLSKDNEQLWVVGTIS